LYGKSRRAQLESRSKSRGGVVSLVAATPARVSGGRRGFVGCDAGIDEKEKEKKRKTGNEI